MASDEITAETDRLERIKQGMSTAGLPAEWEENVRYLLAALTSRNERIAQLERKTDLLSTHVAELTQEMENVRMDFGNGQR